MEVAEYNAIRTIAVMKDTHCSACKFLIEDIAKDINGIQSCLVDFATDKTEIEHSDEKALEVFKEEVDKLGNYKVILP